MSITHWLIRESSIQPHADDAEWNTTKPASFALSSGSGTKTVYACALDDAGNVSLINNSPPSYFDVVYAELLNSSIASDNSFIQITFLEGMYANNDATGNLQTSDFQVIFNRNGGNATSVTLGPVTHTAGSNSVKISLVIT